MVTNNGQMTLMAVNGLLTRRVGAMVRPSGGQKLVGSIVIDLLMAPIAHAAHLVN